MNKRVMPCSNSSHCNKKKAPIIAGLMNGFKVDVGKLMVEHIEMVAKSRKTQILFYPSLVKHLCLQAGLSSPPDAEMRNPSSQIKPLNVQGVDFEPKKKRKKMDGASAVSVNDSSFGVFAEAGCSTAAGAPPVVQTGPPFALQLSSQISSFESQLETRMREIVSNLPQVPQASTIASASTSVITLQNFALIMPD